MSLNEFEQRQSAAESPSEQRPARANANINPADSVASDQAKAQNQTSAQLDHSPENRVEPIDSHDPGNLEISGRQFTQWLQLIADSASRHLDSLADQPSWNTENFEQVAKSFDLAISDQQVKFPGLLDFLFETAIPCSFNTAGPGYLAYIPGGGLPQSSLAELISTVTNRYVGVWAAAPILANIEQAVIRWFCDLFDLPAQAGGILTSGGSMANWSAMIAARTKLLGEEFLDGVVYASEQAHHCVEKAARLCGIRRSHIRMIPTDSKYRLDTAALSAAIQADRAAGRRPFFVTANGGTTNSGAVDPLPEMAEICRAENVWFHVDAAYGGFFALTARGKKCLSGIEQADSIVIDPHKGLFLPYGTGALVVRNVNDLSEAYRIDADYMPDYQDDQDKTDFHEISPELSRDFRGLRVWLPLKLHGAAAFAKALDEKLDLTEWIFERLQEFQSQHSEIEIVAAPQLSLFAFRVKFRQESHRLDELNQRLLVRINARKRVYLTSTRLSGKFVIRICVLSFRTHLDRMQECAEIIENEIRQLEQELASGKL